MRSRLGMRKCSTVVNSWVLTDMKTYEKAIKKERHERIKDLQRGSSVGDQKIIDPYKRGLDTTMIYSRDHLEVFIQKRDIGKIR